MRTPCVFSSRVNRVILVSGIIIGAGYQLPKVKAESIVLIDSKVEVEPFAFTVHVDEPGLTFKVRKVPVFLF